MSKPTKPSLLWKIIRKGFFKRFAKSLTRKIPTELCLLRDSMCLEVQFKVSGDCQRSGTFLTKYYRVCLGIV